MPRPRIGEEVGQYLFHIQFLVSPRGLEPRTVRLKVSCSTN
jgi:hypothetical protein